MKKIAKKMGLVMGRHQMPVGKYVFEEIKDVLDFNKLEAFALLALQNEFDVEGDDDADSELHLYVTGLTAATVAVINAARVLDIGVILYHYDRDSDEYKAQAVT
jgi:hypothetical protein